MPVVAIKTPVPCPVCGAVLPQGTPVICGHCGSELDFESPVSKGPVVKRGSTPAGRRVIEIIIARLRDAKGIDLGTDPMAMERVTDISERVARELADKGTAAVNEPYITAGPSGPVHLDMKLKKEDLA